MSSGLKILYASAEVVPFAKTGGLADVAGALPKVLAEMGHDVRIVMPRYSSIDGEKFGLRPITEPFYIPHGREQIQISIEQSDAIEGVPTYFIRNDYLFDRPGLYGQPDDDHRFIAYCRGLLEMLPQLGWMPDIINCNDWHTGIVAPYLKLVYTDRPEFANIGTLYTIHNLAYQGTFPADVMELAGLPWSEFTWEKLEFYNQLNFMKAGLVYADTIGTVSEKYAQEIQTPEFGCQLDGVLRYRSDVLYGIVNGIDYDIWNPATDQYLPAKFSAEDTSGKAICKRELQQEMGLPADESVPVIGIISRLTSQKGFDLFEEVLPDLLNERDMQVVILGTGDEHYEKLVARLHEQHQDKLSISMKFDNPLAHRIYAGSDLFLMPSFFEPCGLGQMICQAYGTVPIVRATGGLADTVADFKNNKRSKGNGFVFEEYKPDALSDAIQRALECYADKPECWERVVQNTFSCNYSWQNSAKKYLKVYKDAMKLARESQGAQAQAA
ncbi:MAG: glycogen synthase GlgA [Armatimonadota bacterium]